MRALEPSLLCLLAPVGCGGDGFATVEPKNPSQVADGLVFTRADGSSYEMKDALARCWTDPDHPGVQIARAHDTGGRGRGRRPEAVLLRRGVRGVLGTRKLPLEERDHDAGRTDVLLFGVEARTGTSCRAPSRKRGSLASVTGK